MQLSKGSEQLRDSVAEKSRLLADLRRAEALGSAGAPSRAIDSGGQSLVVLIDSTGKTAGLAASITRTRPDGPDGISVSFQNAPFDGLLTWLVSLEAEHGVAVETASFNGARDPGLVSGQLFLRR
jgi:type II secretory pathway component PulM